MKEHKIGETFTYKEKAYIVAEPEGHPDICCKECAFDHSFTKCTSFRCTHLERTDKRQVIAKLVET